MGRQLVRLLDEHGRIIRWDPRLGRASQINVFQRDERDLARGDRIQWRLAKNLQERAVGDISSLSNMAPNVSLDAGTPFSGSTAVLSAFIRGIGQIHRRECPIRR